MATTLEPNRDAGEPSLDVIFAESSAFGQSVRTYWEAHGEFPHVRERVLPTADIFLLVNLGSPHVLISAHGESVHSNAWVSGIQQTALLTGALGRADVWGAKLTPYAAHLAFGAIGPLANRVVDLADLMGSAGIALSGRLREAVTFKSRCRLFDQHMADRFNSGASQWRPEIAWAFDQILADGSTRISNLAGAIGWSRKHLHAQFVEHFGHSPKSLARVVRFERGLQLMASRPKTTLAEIALAAGYSDQPQFTREFRAHAGITPAVYSRNRVAGADYSFIDADG